MAENYLMISAENPKTKRKENLYCGEGNLQEWQEKLKQSRHKVNREAYFILRIINDRNSDTPACGAIHLFAAYHPSYNLQDFSFAHIILDERGRSFLQKYIDEVSSKQDEQGR